MADGRFVQGRSGNPAGRQRGSKNRATLAALSLLEGQAEALTGKAVELALGGNVAALRFCLSRITAPRREPAVQFALPPLDSLSDVVAATAAVAAASADGVITPGEALAVSRVLDALLRAIKAREAERREKHFWSGQTRDRP
ncbi:MAG TPA: DUF5681 domain-containing protein [Stellaceae bacterium]